MKKFFTLLFLSLLFRSILFAAAPTVPASNLTFSSLDGAQFTGNFTVGNGTARMVVIKQGSPVTGVPVNGTDYTYNSIFGTAAAAFTAPGEYVVSKTGFNSFTVTNLQPGQIYYVAIFEYSGSGAGIQYLSLPLTGSQTTVIAPTVQTNTISATATGNTMTLNWTKGNGTGRIIVARKASAVNVTPNDLTNYFSDVIYGNGTQIGTGNYVVYKGTGATTTIKNLEPNTVYHFAFFEYNGNVSPMHLTPGATFSSQTNAGPNIAPGAAGFNFIEGNSMTIAVTIGNGTRRLFIARKNAAVTASPVNGTTYTANAAFGTASAEIAPGEFVVAATTGNSVNVTNLEPNTIYHFRVFEYDQDLAGNTYYLTSTFAVKNGSTSTTPTTVASNFNMVSLTGSSATISFTAGNGNYRTVVMKAGSPVDAAPADLTKYTSNANFGSGAQITPGNYVIHSGMNGSQFPVSNLTPGTTYYVAIFEYNGNNAPVYSATAGTYSFTVPLQPTVAATSPWSVFNEGSSFRLVWTNGNGGRRIVIAKKASAVIAAPTDQISYTANAAFGQGDVLAPGEFVVYNGTANSVDVTNMEIGTTYHFAVYEYNVGGNGLPDYLTSSWLAANAATVTYPTTQTIISNVTNIQATTATINFTAGNGGNRMFIMRQGAAVNVTPQDLVKYTYNGAFGNGGNMGNGNYIIAITSANNTINVTNLQPNTTYYVNAYELNGWNEPAYLISNPGTYSFTTSDVAGATVPTIAASNALVNTVEGNKFTFKWTNGNGEKRIVVMRQGSAVTFVPASATSYTANAAFGAGTDLGSGQYVVYSGNGSSVDLTNLLPSTNYYFAVYEFNGTGTLLRYLTSSYLSATAGTLFAPTSPSANINSITGNGQATLTWTNGNGTGRILVLKELTAVSAAPVDLSIYPANAVFKTGSQIAAGEWVVYAGTGNSVTITGLENKAYHFALFEYNGTSAPVYNTSAIARGTFTVSSILPVRLSYFTGKIVNNKSVLNWATSQEINNAAFVIEKSSDAVRYNEIAKIDGAGNSSSTINYSYTDPSALTGKTFYRLKQVDVNGHFTYSVVVVIDNNRIESGLMVYPNPVKDQFRISLPKSVRNGVLKVYNSNGVVLLTEKVVDGTIVNTSEWSGGNYFLTVNSDGEIWNTRVVK